MFPQHPQPRSEQQYSKAPPMVIYAHLKCNWAKGDQIDTLNYLRDFSAKLARDIQASAPARADPVGNSKLEELSRLLARCYFKQGEWQFALKEEWDDVRTLPTKSRPY